MSTEPILTFYKFHRSAPHIRPAERSAAGVIPAAAFQYCEAVRQASCFGYYVYPPKDIHLLFDGKEVFQYEDDTWYPLKSVNFQDEFREDWEKLAPLECHEMDPAYLSELFVPGLVQIWTGYFVETVEGWSISIRSPVNYDVRSSFKCFEGIVETDEFRPAPLFVNIQLLATNREIYISEDKPLFQVQPLPNTLYRDTAKRWAMLDMTQTEGADFDWPGLERTIRRTADHGTTEPGRYAKAARKRDMP